jgi:hypothetical protein
MKFEIQLSLIFFGRLTYIQWTIMLHDDDHYYTKKKRYAIGINHYLTRCLLIIELINNDIMWWYFPFFPKFSFNEIHNPFFILEIGYIFPIEKKLL